MDRIRIDIFRDHVYRDDWEIFNFGGLKFHKQ